MIFFRISAKILGCSPRLLQFGRAWIPACISWASHGYGNHLVSWSTTLCRLKRGAGWCLKGPIDAVPSSLGFIHQIPGGLVHLNVLVQEDCSFLFHLTLKQPILSGKHLDKHGPHTDGLPFSQTTQSFKSDLSCLLSSAFKQLFYIFCPDL